MEQQQQQTKGDVLMHSLKKRQRAEHHADIGIWSL
jgi:hypothetical protein